MILLLVDLVATNLPLVEEIGARINWNWPQTEVFMRFESVMHKWGYPGVAALAASVPCITASFGDNGLGLTPD